MKIILVRHAQTNIDPSINSAEWGLSDIGREQASALGRKDLFLGAKIIYSSMQPKATETASIIASIHDMKLIKNEGLGELTSVTRGFIDNYVGTVGKLYSGQIENIHGGETLLQAQDRFNLAIESIIKENPKTDKLVIVSHANVLSLFTAQYCSKDASDLHDSIAMPDIAVLDISIERRHFDVLWAGA